MPMSDSRSEEEPPVSTHPRLAGSVSLKPASVQKPLRKARSGDMSSGNAHGADGRCGFAHQRTTSASSLSSVALALSINSPPSPTVKRVGRFASAIRSGLRRTPVPHTAPWPGSRARAATNVAAYHSLPTRLIFQSLSSCSPSVELASKSTASSTQLLNSNSSAYQQAWETNVVAGYGIGGLPSLLIGSTLPSPPSTASTGASGLLSAASTISASSPVVSVDAAGAQYQPLFCDSDVGAATSALGTFRPRKRSLSVGGENACHDFFVRQIEQYGLQSLLTSPVAVCYFMASAISNYSPETLLFYLEVEHYRSANFASNDRRTRYAKGLYKAFISNRAPLEINISHGMRQRITQAFRNDSEVTTGMFKETQDHAYALLEQDYSTFRQRPLFHRMMAELSSSPTPGGSSSRKETQMLHTRAVSAIYDALSKTYGVYTLSASKSKLVESEMPTFTKFADMDLTSTELKTALPAWLCRTTVRLIDTPMPVSYEQMCQLQRNGGELPSQTTCVCPATTATHVQSSSIGGDMQATLLPPNLPLLLTHSPVLTSLPLELLSRHTTSESEDIMHPAARHGAVTMPTASASCTGHASSDTKHNKKANKQKSLQRLRFKFQTDPSNTSRQKSIDNSQDSTLLPPTKSRWESLWSARRRKAT
ncbi:G-protein signaling regulator protein [Coemansia sp. IMI 209127]|nr:G-protein signaling regulator protein [Coemansia sp. IMI 209127]